MAPKTPKPRKQKNGVSFRTPFLLVILAVVVYFVLDTYQPELLQQLTDGIDQRIKSVSNRSTANVAPGAETKNRSVLNPEDFVSKQKSKSKRIGAEKKSADVIKAPSEGVSKSLEELGSPFVKYMHSVPPVTGQRPMGAKFRNFKRYPLTKYWDDGSATGVFSGRIPPMGYTATNTYTTHVFIFRDERHGKSKEVARFTMRDDMHLMIIEPDEDDTETRASHAYIQVKREQKYMRDYYAEHKTPWLSYYPREKPRLDIWPADYVGQTHKVTSFQGYFTCDPFKQASPGECYDETPAELSLVVVSTEPRVLVIENLMSDWECEHIKELGEKVIRRSAVGSAKDAYESNTRTSENGWLTRHHDAVLDTIFRRFADVLSIRDEDLEHDISAENLQVVRYLQGQEYQPHHDFGYTGKPNQRFLTLLLYIEVPEEGGHTSFPKAHGGRGMLVKPPKGGAALFYSMKPDGNADDMSLHAGTPVTKGTKWVCNLWVWDPEVNFKD